MVLLDKSGDGRPYVLLLPLLEGPFRASLQPGSDDFIDICVESGSTKVTGATFNSVLYIHAGEDPYTLVKDAMKIVRAHLGTFKLMEEKSPPGKCSPYFLHCGVYSLFFFMVNIFKFFQYCGSKSCLQNYVSYQD